MKKSVMNDLEERIIYEKENVLVVNKPYNVPSTGSCLNDDDCLQYWLMKRHGGMVWAIHQLDADTSGVNIFVTDKKLVSLYKKSLEQKNANKEYLAIVHGSPDWNQHEEFGAIGMIDDRSLGIHPEGKSAHSKFTVIKRGECHTFLKAQIFTGRTHQIRIHLSHLGHPVVGDDWYCNPPCQEHVRQALHCHSIHLLDSNELFTASLPQDLEALLLKLNIN
jgi:23S rRNA pseudouridine1911/1915/1917 synthase